MQNATKLILVKTGHTLIWLFFNVVIFYMLYASITGNLNLWLWLGYVCVFLEGIVLLYFKGFCPLTLLAGHYADSHNDNFDIYLPEWLARYTKLIYSVIVLIIVVITIFQLLK